MAQVASEIGVSLRTLHRHFPSKALLVWGPLEGTFGDLERRLDAVSADLPMLQAMAEAITSCLSPNSDSDVSARERLRMIATTPELQEVQSAAFLVWRRALIDFAVRRSGNPSDMLAATALGTAVQGAVMTGLSWWATQEPTTSASAIVRRAILALDSHRSPRNSSEI